VRPAADKKGLCLSSELDPALGTMESDRRRVEQILINLLNNAVKFTDRGVVVLRARREQVDGAPWLQVQVVDTGVGIRPEDLGSLFLPFRQLDTGLARSHEGTGLGLAICRKLARLLGGEIHATSDFPHGSVFTVTLPLRKVV
jgi:signal transduction histidine kinase